MRNICILGATGSIGKQTLDIIRKQRDDFTLFSISANKSFDAIIEIISEFIPKYAAIADAEVYSKVKQYCELNGLKTNVLNGMDGIVTAATLDEVDLVVNSVVGMIGLKPTIEAIRAKKNIALANKETLVAGGEIVIKLAKENNVSILPVDSEHGAIFQCLQGNLQSNIEKIILTASGGPFRGKSINELSDIKPEDALKHPKWNMGKKISIDSATLMNKGLEVIEAHWLFNVDYSDIEVVVHPQSIIHSMIEYIDGSVIAQLGSTDMRLPIQYALNYPSRKDAAVDKLNFYALKNLTFEEPDFDTFRCLKLAYDAGKTGGTMPTILNSANEIAVDLFLNNEIKFMKIPDIVEDCLQSFEYKVSNINLEDVLTADYKVRRFVKNKYSKSNYN